MQRSPSILFITKSVEAASARYRAANYLPYLQRSGLDVRLVTVDACRGRNLYREIARADVTVVSRRTFGWLERRRVRRAARKLVFDFDDAIYRSSSGPSSGRRRRFAWMASHADQIWAGNGDLAEYAKQYNSNVFILPTAVDADRYEVKHTKPPEFIDLVWIGSSSTRRYIKEALPHTARARQALTNLRLKIVADFQLEHPEIDIVSVPWSSQAEVEALTSAHIGLAPLPDNEWTRGKCGFKILQYHAAGLPVVASDLPVHREMIQDDAGLVVSGPDEWCDALIRLSRDASLREMMGRVGRRRVEATYDAPVIARRMVELLKSTELLNRE
jgi:glycosyltransferase involved in cell wall biosynthesis